MVAALPAPSETLVAPARAGSGIHFSVRANRPLRAAAHAAAGVLAASMLWSQRASVPALMWAALAFSALLWMPVAYGLARHARDSRAAERRNLMADTAILGLWSGLLGADLWICVCFFAGSFGAAMSVGGPRFAFAAVPVFGAMLLAALYSGWALAGEPTIVTYVLTGLTLLGYFTLGSMQNYYHARAAIRTAGELRAHSDVIEQQSAELAKALAAAEDARRSAEDANRAKSEFLANMSHELRTPLNAVIGYAEILHEELTEGPPGESALADLARISTSARHLLALINDVLDLSRMEAGRVTLDVREFELHELLDPLRAAAGSLMEPGGNRFVLDVEPLASGWPQLATDPQRLRQVLTKLLSNAAKFTQGGTVTLVVREQRQADPLDGSIHRSALFEIRDTGIGIAADKQPLLFRPFVQADSGTTRRYGGSGLGLAISRKLCRAMGGELVLASTPGEGSVFTATVRIDFPSAS